MSNKATACAALSILLIAGFTIVAPTCQTTAAAAAPGPAVELLGNPTSQLYDNRYPYFRNVWDMRVYHGRIYLGCGCSAPDGPPPGKAGNLLGPVPVYSLDPATGQFTKEFAVDDQQIDVYRVIGDDLVIPGQDAIEDWSAANWYRLRDGHWQKYRNIPNTVHVFDMISYRGDLWAAITATDVGGGVSRSTDDGKTWSNMVLWGAWRTQTLFPLGDLLYASCRGVGGIPTEPVASYLYAWDGVKFQWNTGSYSQMFPNSTHSDVAVMERPVSLLDQVVYIGADPVNGNEWSPFGLFTARSIDAAQKVPLLDGERPWDIKVDDGVCYVLTGRRSAQASDPGQYQIRVLASSDLLQWREVVSFWQPTFARSFAILNGSCYFGLGCETDAQPAETGEILRVREQG